MQSVSSRIWTRVAVSISYDNKHYTTGTSFTNPSARAGYDTRSIFFFFCLKWTWYNIDMSKWSTNISYKIDSKFQIHISLFIQIEWLHSSGHNICVVDVKASICDG